jgi:hypothetical protein
MILRIWCSLLLISSVAASSQSAVAQSWSRPIALTYADRPLETKLLTDVSLAQGRSDVITADTISARERSNPSLWWTSEQLPGKLVLNWLAYPEQKYVDVVVNSQFWNVLDYPERYQLVNTWGTAARKYGFDVRIFNLRFSDREPIVAYICTHESVDRRCVVKWQSANQNSFGIKSIVR